MHTAVVSDPETAQQQAEALLLRLRASALLPTTLPEHHLQQVGPHTHTSLDVTVAMYTSLKITQTTQKHDCACKFYVVLLVSDSNAFVMTKDAE